MDLSLPSQFVALLFSLRPAFQTEESFHRFAQLLTAWALAVGRHTVTALFHAGDLLRDANHSTFYRFFSRSHWDPDLLGKLLAQSIITLCPGMQLFVILDDTLCLKVGDRVFGAGMGYDGRRSSYGRKSGSRKAMLSYGQRFVILCLHVHAPWNVNRGFALPVLVRLQKSKKRCSAKAYRKTTQLGRELVETFQSWFPKRHVIVLGDAEYACRQVVRDLPNWTSFVGPMDWDAALYDTRPRPYSGSGARPKYGVRLPNPKQWLDDDRLPWKEVRVRMYGRRVTLLIKHRLVFWRRVTGLQPVRMVLVRDPKGEYEDRAIVSTATNFRASWVVKALSRRWQIEVTIHECKDLLGFEDPQNGFSHSNSSPERQAEAEQAAQRTAPMALWLYSLTVLWYCMHGAFRKDTKRAREESPYYRSKKDVSFADMLRSLREKIWSLKLREVGLSKAVSAEMGQLIARLCQAA